MSLRVGIAGYGLAGRYFHAPLLKGCGFEVAAVLTTNPVRVGHALQDFPATVVVESMQELVGHNLDLVVVASANLAHAEQATAALKAGIPVVVDKPMGRNVNQDSWRENMSAEDGGGQLLDLQPHLISTAIDWFGKAELVTATVRSIRGAADDDSVLVLRHESGVMSYLSASAVVGAPGPRIRILGSKGALVINDLDPQEALLRAGKYPAGAVWSEPTTSAAFIHRGTEVEEIQGVPGNYALFYAAVASAISKGTPWPISNDDALLVASIIDQARTIGTHA